ncbi:hypothetical protein MSG28_005873 [Choristoneura fumiferana]|uniref:Uncharacterized protein n=2 Tax=Choristoneura fumiferana TaxID=7141 RepID=A0ACC0L142_CHOFU|nr:hypothetical protein MSG28_005873 [Choristoneura fumiferana]KAI8442344.1 hypothetical protein MSG28_005873 [Choristoneura fumiferana]
MMAKGLAGMLALCLVGNAISVPLDIPRPRRGFGDNEVESVENSRGDTVTFTLPPIKSTYKEKKRESQTPDPFDDDDDDWEPMQTAPTGGSNIMSLLNLASGLFPGSSGPFQIIVREMIREFLRRDTYPYLLRRHDSKDNEIDIDYKFDSKPPPFQRQETEESDSDSDSDESEEDNDNAAEESVEGGDKDSSSGDNDTNASQEKTASNGDDDGDDDYDSDEPPGGGDGQGGGVLGLLAGLSGGEDGQSDLGSLLAAVSGIVVSLSGDGIDLNNIIASGIGLFVGLLSEGEENPGEILASYLLTSLDTITGGGSKNNGAFFGKLLSKLISGTSAGEAPEGSSDESGEPEVMKDSGGFLLSLLMGLSGDMSKSSSKGSSHPW